MTCKELAELLDGRQYLDGITLNEQRKAKDSGLVAVMGFSDDCMDFVGAISEEIDCYEGGKVYIKNGKVYPDDFTDTGEPIDECYAIKAIWCPKNADCSWAYETDIPHETFNIYEEDELYCVGIVFNINALFPSEESAEKALREVKENDDKY